MLDDPIDDCWDELSRLPTALTLTDPIEFGDAGFWPSILQNNPDDQLSFGFASRPYYVKQQSTPPQWGPSLLTRIIPFIGLAPLLGLAPFSLTPIQLALLEQLYGKQLYLPGLGPNYTALSMGRRAGKTFNFALLYGMGPDAFRAQSWRLSP